MGTRLLFLYVVCQTVITESLGGVVPVSNLIGKVTPIKPKPLPASTVSSSIIKSSICDSRDVLPKLFPTASGGSLSQEFSSPLAFTSSSRALPVPKIDAFSIADVKMPERLREKFLLLNASVRTAKPDICSPEMSSPYKNPFLSTPITPSNCVPTYFSLDTYFGSMNKLSSLPSITSLPTVPVEQLRRNSAYSIRSNPSSILASKSVSLDSRTPSFSEQFTPNVLFPSSSSCSLPYPLYYKSMCLPGVRTPSEPLSYRPITYKEAGNFNFPNQVCSENVLLPKTSTYDSNLNSFAHRSDPCLSSYLEPIKISGIPYSINTVQLPRTSSNLPLSAKPVISLQDTVISNPWSPNESKASSASVTFESRLNPPESLSSLIDSKGQKEPKPFLNSMPCSLPDRISDFKLKPCTLPKIKPIPLAMSPSNFINSPSTPLVPISPSFPIVNVLSNQNGLDCLRKNDNIPDLFNIISSVVESMETLNTNNDLTTKMANPLLCEECISVSPPIIPLEPLTCSGTSTISPITYCPSRISQTPVSYINQTPPSSIAQSTSNMVSSINDLVSNIAQNILSSYTSYINTDQRNPYDIPGFIPTSVCPLSQGNPVNAIPILPIISTSIDSINLPVLDCSTIISLDTTYRSPECECSSSPLPISSPQLTTVLPPTSLMPFASPQICPSYLPSPRLPTYQARPSPFYVEAPVYKVCSSKKDSDAEKILELMILAEILNNDESFDWDDLDTLLALLSVS